MEKHLKLLLFLGVSTLNYAQESYDGRVGINTQLPNATLEIMGKPTQTEIIDGIILPKITKRELHAKTGYNSLHKGAIVYVSETEQDFTPKIVDGAFVPPTIVNDKFTQDGYYYWDGSKWLPLEEQGILTKIYHKEYGYQGWGTHHRKENESFYGEIGEKAIDFSYAYEYSLPKKPYGATGNRAIAFGKSNIASSSNGFVGGLANENHGENSFAYGKGNKILQTGYNSVIMGEYNTVEGYDSVVFGHSNIAKESLTFASGFGNQANGRGSFATGLKTEANSYLEFAQGTFNKSYPAYSTKNFDKRDLIESVGGGETERSRKNLLERYKSGVFRYNAQVLNSTNIPNAQKGFHAADENGKLNYHNGTTWETYITVKFSTTEPTNAQKGDMYFNTTSNKYFAFDGTSWNALW